VNTVLLYITIAFFLVVIATVIVALVASSHAHTRIEEEMKRDTGATPTPQYRRS
jgi:hypothetical protein